jgi:hypothetical protein
LLLQAKADRLEQQLQHLHSKYGTILQLLQQTQQLKQ